MSENRVGGTVTYQLMKLFNHNYYANMVRYTVQLLPLPNPPPEGEGANSTTRKGRHFNSHREWLERAQIQHPEKGGISTPTREGWRGRKFNTPKRVAFQLPLPPGEGWGGGSLRSQAEVF